MEARNTNTPSTKSPARSKMTTILLKILIPDHLYVFHHHGRGPSCRSQRSHLLADALGEGGYRLGEWPTDHDMYPHLVGTDDHAGYLLAHPVGRDFHEAPGRQRVNPVCGEGRLRGGPRQLQVVGQESPVYLSARYCLPDPLLLLGLLLLLELTPALLLLLLALLLRKNTSLTATFTSVTLRPTRFSTRLMTF